MRTRRLLAGLVGSAMALTLASAAFASTPLHQTTPIDADNVDFNLECTAEELQMLDDAGATVAWHFILLGANSDTGDMWARFTNPDDEATVSIFKQEGNATHFYILNDSWTLGNEDAGDDPDAATVDPLEGDQLNLSHVCYITPPTPTPTLPPTSTIDTTPATPAGTNLGLILGAILLAAGGLTVFAMRPRRSNG